MAASGQLLGTELGSLRAVRGEEDIPFDKTKCIVCQTDLPDIPPTSTDNGRNRIQEAAEIRSDDVLRRLKSLHGSDFVYHMNNKCYKIYTLKKTLQKIETDNRATRDVNNGNTQATDLDEPPPKRTRSSILSRSAPSSQEPPLKLRCVVCGRCQHNGVREKFRICESARAKKFLTVAMYFKDDVFERISDLEDESRVFGADLYYHKQCLEPYLNRYNQIQASDKHSHRQSPKHEAFDREINSLKILIDQGYGISLSEIRDIINSKTGENIISNKEVKLFIESFGETIQFCNSERKNEPLMVFSSKFTVQETVKRMRSLNSTRTVAETIRQSLLNLDMGLDDKFCDAEELMRSWNNLVMPETLLTFFAVLFNVKRETILPGVQTNPPESSPFNSDPTEDDANDPSENRTFTKVQSLFQVMFYNVHRGRKKTPLHTMMAHTVYDKCKSRELITAMNKIGFSVSYNDIIRSRNKLAAYAILSSESKETPLPSHFHKDEFTIGALDNFDHADRSSLSGTFSNHDTVQIMFQSRPKRVPSKPNVSATNLRNVNHNLLSELPCQRIRFYKQPVSRPSLPLEFKVERDLLHLDERIKLQGDIEFTLSLTRVGIISQRDDTPSWAGCHALCAHADLPLMNVGFLPYIPHPVTQHSTVYTAMHNFLSILEQLGQSALPIFCDEGIFHIVVDIVLSRPGEFDRLIPMLGSFHTAKVVEHCIGKYLRGSGITDALVESEVFGVKTVESIMNGTHYVRSFRGILIVADAIEKMKWEAFWKATDESDFGDIYRKAVILKDLMQEKDIEGSRKQFKCVISEITDLRNHFELFSLQCSERSEMCKYWDGFLNIVSLLKNLVASDREGDWEGHLQSMQDLLSVFRESDSINYLRYAAWYVEKMRLLPKDHPDIYQKFKDGHFVVKQNQGDFNAVAPDMKLEQTIQRSQKSAKGIIGQTRQVAYVSKWELVYHEVLAICNTFREITNYEGGYRETVLHHELAGNISAQLNASVQNVNDFMMQRENPYLTCNERKLHNFITKQLVPRDIALRLLAFTVHGKAAYNDFRQERFVDKTHKLSDTIRKVKLPTFLSKPSVTVSNQKPSNISEIKTLTHAQRAIDIAKGRGAPIDHILKYDLLMTNTLFDDFSTKKPAKHLLLTELEKNLERIDYSFTPKSSLPTGTIVDFMSNVRRVKTTKLHKFGDIFEVVWCNCIRTYESQQIDFVYDSYIDHSIKECERLRRYHGEPIEFVSLNQDTVIPVQLDIFWSSSKNKEMLQTAAKDFFTNRAKTSGIKTIQSGVLSDDGGLTDAIEVTTESHQVTRTDLNVYLEEADLRIVPHIMKALDNGIKRIVVLSNDTDVVVLLLYYLFHYINHGLSQLWILIGSSDETSRYIPLHTLGEKLGPIKCSVMLKAHILTGCDVTSKVGTKTASIKAEPEKYLVPFGDTATLSDITLSDAEEYLAKVLQPNSTFKTLNQLRCMWYKTKSKPLCDLPPTSHSLHGHLQRCHFIIWQYTNLLNDNVEVLDPHDFGWKDDMNIIIPDKCLHSLPKDLIATCGCKTKCTARCTCRKYAVICTEYCTCMQAVCENN